MQWLMQIFLAVANFNVLAIASANRRGNYIYLHQLTKIKYSVFVQLAKLAKPRNAEPPMSTKPTEGGALYERRGLPVLLHRKSPYLGLAMRNKSA